MFRTRAIALAGALSIPVLLVAQNPFDAKAAEAMTATWTLDRDRSEPVPDVGGAPTALVPRDPPAGAPTGGPPAGGGGGGRRGGGGGGGSGASGSAPQGLGPRRRGGAGMRNPYVRELMTQLNAPEEMAFAASGSEVSITVADVVVTWTPDGQKHQHAQIDGTLLQDTARWKGDKLELIDGVEGAAELKREIKLIDDGQALEMKLELGGPSFPKKVTRKVVYVRR